MKIKLLKRIFFFLLLLFFLLLSVYANPLTIKLGSPAPSGSPWDKALRELAAEWMKISNGQIQVRIYPDGVAGDESDTIRKMRFNTLQAAVLTGLGLNTIAQDVLALSIPLLIQTDEEFQYVLEKVEPFLEEKIERQGFKVIAWTNTGWVHFFGRRPIVYPRDLKRQKLATSDTDPAMARALKEMGYDTIPLALNDVLPALSSGMVDACYNVPLGAAAYQWFGIAKNMMELPLGPVIGGIVMSTRAWNRIDDSLKPRFLEAADRAAGKLFRESKNLAQEAITIMKQNGLTINPTPPDAEKAWKEEFQKGFDLIKGDTFSIEIYERIKEHLSEFRSR